MKELWRLAEKVWVIHFGECGLPETKIIFQNPLVVSLGKVLFEGSNWYYHVLFGWGKLPKLLPANSPLNIDIF